MYSGRVVVARLHVAVPHFFDSAHSIGVAPSSILSFRLRLLALTRSTPLCNVHVSRTDVNVDVNQLRASI